MSKSTLVALSGIVLVALVGVFFASCGGGFSPGGDQDVLHKIKRSGRLVAGVKYDSKPFGYLDTDGEVKGFDVDLIREITTRLSKELDVKEPIQVHFQQVFSSTRIIGLNMGKLDLVAATMTITPEREKLIDFSDVYYTAHQAVLVPDGSRFKSVRDLEKGMILYVIGTTSEQNIRLALPKAKFRGYKSSVEAFSSLKASRGDAMTSDDTILYGFIGDTCRYHMLPEELSQEPYGLGIRQDSDGSTTRFRLLINKILKEMKEDGTIAALSEKWMAPYEDLSICKKPRQAS